MTNRRLPVALSTAAVLASMTVLLTAAQPAPKTGIAVTVLNSYWATDSSFWVRLTIRNKGLEPITFKDKMLSIIDDRGARYELTEPSPNFSANVRLNPGQSHLAVLACAVEDQSNPNGYTLLIGDKGKIPLKIRQPGKRK